MADSILPSGTLPHDLRYASTMSPMASHLANPLSPRRGPNFKGSEHTGRQAGVAELAKGAGLKIPSLVVQGFESLRPHLLILSRPYPSSNMLHSTHFS